ncbi:MAG: 4-alpha-glucanotransferase [Deltaproteobacteria bacterium]|jgi:4-alpha-glucanotransferase|nr:4-alpha-glucanotransferase [Deltaproteobacteria bacterium]MBT6434846.1 4-alpha-glucanotransferase [Deltaproteobacteria bacterium]
MKYVCIHGHFYQPDRTNPITGQIEPESSAAPYQNWNDRIFSECYGVNASTPIVTGTQNNYRHLSADFGPTLLRWMEKSRPRTYAAIIDSQHPQGAQERDNGNMMAQGYHHAILPLANANDIETEITWGIRDFEHRFGTIPHGFWLPETAANTEVLAALLRLGVEYVVLSPNQAESIRTPQGQEYFASELSPTELSQRPYLVDTLEGQMTVFFYHGGLAQAVAFDGALANGESFAQTIIAETQTCENDSLLHFATDGESYGHHHAFGHLALGHLIHSLEQSDDVELTSYTTYLKQHPPEWTASIKENSSWSCAHGLGRWEKFCGCHTGANEHWQQDWRAQLRETLNWLRDVINPVFLKMASKLLKDPWKARNDYIKIILTPDQEVRRDFLKNHLKSPVCHRGIEETVFGLLETQRHLLNMYTSCGWFFDDVAGLEPLQNIRHALEAARLASEYLKLDLETDLRLKIDAINSNEPGHYKHEIAALFQKQKNNVTTQSTTRKAGVLLHLSSLPGEYGIGDLGAEARQFVDWMVTAGITVWQFLPLGPIEENGACYSSWSSLSGNPWLVDLRDLKNQGLLTDSELKSLQRGAQAHVDFQDIGTHKERMLEIAAARFLEKPDHPWQTHWETFKNKSPWAERAGLFRYLKKKNQGKPWWLWPMADRKPTEKHLASQTQAGQNEILVWMVLEFFFERQYNSLRQYCEARSIELLGDVAMYVAGDSVDVWIQQDLFELNEHGEAASVAGAPPDAFNADGQRWGNPIYNWEAMEQQDYRFWKERFQRGFEHADRLRFDHFRGLAAYWKIPASAPTASGGSWVQGPGKKLFTAITEDLGELPLIVEDLGDIDDAVCELRDTLAYPGMTVLQFGFDEQQPNEHTPCNYRPQSIVYTGTHDCATTLGWWQEQPESVRDRVRRYCSSDGNDIVWDMIRMAMAAVSQTAIIPMQDILGLDDESRMNTPGTIEGNWSWRLGPNSLQEADHRRLKSMIELFGRANRS